MPFLWEILNGERVREGEGGGGAAGAGVDGAGGSAPAGGAGGAPAGDGGDAPSLLSAAAGGTPAPEVGDKPADGEAVADGEKKPEGDKPAETPEEKAAREAREAEEAAKPKDVDGKPVPDAYEFKMPDGFVADQSLLDEATPIFKEAKLSPAQAQTVVDLYAKVTGKQIEQHAATVRAWAEATKTDKEIGGPDYEKNIAQAGAAFKSFGDPDLGHVLDHYGLGNHPAVLRFFSRVGKAFGEGTTVRDGGAATSRLPDAAVFYPDMGRK